MRRPGSISEQTSAVADVDLDRTRTSTSCGPDRDESPAPSSNSGYSCVPGDSEASDTEGCASADEGQSAPTRRGGKPCPMPAKDGEPDFTGPRSTHWNNRPTTGNCGIFFGNWGQRTQQGQGCVQGNIDAQMKKNPCAIIGLTECEAATENMLRASAVADERPWDETETFENRKAYEFHTLRGEEPVSCLLGCRTTCCSGLEKLHWHRKFEGTYKSKTKKDMKAYTRLLVAKVFLKTNVGGIGRELRVAVCHLHFQVANNNKGFKTKHKEFWPLLAKEMKYHEVQVLMGDFNMSLFKVVPELRSHGIQATLISWFPWRTAESGEVMADSCGIFSLTHADEIAPSVQPNILAEDMVVTLPPILKNAGPGQPLAVYLPKDLDLSKKIYDSLEPLPIKIEEEDETQSAAVAETEKIPLKWKGKPLAVEIWRHKGQHYKGSHFPLALFTDNQSRRSEQAYCRRSDKSKNKRWENRPR